MEEVSLQIWQNPSLDSDMTGLNSAHILMLYFCNIHFNIIPNYAQFCQVISRIFTSKSEEIREGRKNYVIRSFIVCQ